MDINKIDIHKMDINKDFTKYKIINIHSECIKENPCYHSVNIQIIVNERVINNCLLSSETIAEYYKYNNIEIPFHFSDRGIRN
jgi:hypothetical protein